MSFANLKSNRGSSIDKLVKAAEAVTTKTETKSYADDRFWKPTQDKAGNGYAVIRFLPTAKVRIYLGYDIGIMGSKDLLVYGISKTA